MEGTTAVAGFNAPQSPSVPTATIENPRPFQVPCLCSQQGGAFAELHSHSRAHDRQVGSLAYGKRREER
ncbi:hypothetical protein E4U53_003208 [Claviceps sorghi]|nr:hypothetical protein E4U53_003208 [Claviceps sorghi]